MKKLGVVKQVRKVLDCGMFKKRSGKRSWGTVEGVNYDHSYGVVYRLKVN